MRRPTLFACRSGASSVEFALLAPLFFALLIGTLQQGVSGMVSANFEDAVGAAARHIRTGQAEGTTDAAAFKALICRGMIDPAATCQARLTVEVNPLNRFTVPGGQLKDPKPGKRDRFDAGGPGDIILVTATYDWPMVTPFLGDGFSRVGSTTARMTSRMLFKNEPYG